MPTHDVRFTLPECPLGVADADFTVKKDSKPFGTLKVSHGAVVWIPAGGKNHRRVSWTALASFIEEKGTVLRTVRRKPTKTVPAKKVALRK